MPTSNDDAKLDVTILGSSDAFCSGGHPHATYLVETRRATFLVDCGPTVLLALKQRDVDTASIDFVVISHLHGDHFGGVPFLVLDGQFRRRTRDLTVIGPPSTRSRLDQVMEAMFPGSSTAPRRFAVHVAEHVDGRAVELASLRVTPFEVRHASGAPAYALRVDGPSGSLAYSGDTEWTDGLLDAARDVDLFLCEGYSPAPIRWHLDLTTLSNHRDRFTCRQLVLTHLSPTALASDLANWQVAYDGVQFDL